MRSSSTDASSTDTLRAELLQRYQRNRARSRELFALLSDAAYYSQPIALRHPIVFYEGHLPGFSFNTLVKTALGGSSVDARLEALFARGIDPARIVGRGIVWPGRRGQWPSRREVRAFADEADRRVVDAVTHADIDQTGPPAPRSRRSGLRDPRARGDAPGNAALHVASSSVRAEDCAGQLSAADGRRGRQPRSGSRFPRVARRSASIAAHSRSRGTTNVRRASAVVPAFSIERHDVTNAQFLEFVEAGGYRDPQWWTADDWQWLQLGASPASGVSGNVDGHDWFWRGMFEPDPAAAVLAGLREPGGSIGVRAMARRAPPDGSRVSARRLRIARQANARTRGAITIPTRHPACLISRVGIPSRRAAIPAGASAWGVEDLVGNGWEWTDTAFAPFPGFRAHTVVPGVLGRFLRRRAFRDEGRVAGDGS